MSAPRRTTFLSAALALATVSVTGTACAQGAPPTSSAAGYHVTRHVTTGGEGGWD